MAMAQRLESAKYDSIIRGAISSGLVDHLLPVEQMPDQLQEYAEHVSSTNGDARYSRPKERDRLNEISFDLSFTTGDRLIR